MPERGESQEKEREQRRKGDFDSKVSLPPQLPFSRSSLGFRSCDFGETESVFNVGFDAFE